MLSIRCTQKLLKELKVTPTQEEQQGGYLGGWHADLFRVERRKCVLITNDLTLYSLFIPGLKKPELEQFGEVFMQHLFKNLRCEGFTQDQIELVLNEYREIKIAKTNNRSVLGSMNDLKSQAEHIIWELGGLLRLDVIELNHKLNRIPMGAIKYSYSIKALKKRLAEIET